MAAPLQPFNKFSEICEKHNEARTVHFRKDKQCRTSFCASCKREKNLAWSQRPENKAKKKKSNLKNRDSVKNGQLQYHFGLSLKEYNQLFETQEGRCAVCKRHQSEFKKALCVDHNHNTGRVRGLLCNPCNQAYGLLKESLDNVLSLLEYHKKYEGGI